MSYIIVNIFKLIFMLITLINFMAIISDINMWLCQWLKFLYYQQWSLNQWLGNYLFIHFLLWLHCYSVTISWVHHLCWGRDEMDAITQTTFSSAFFWKKTFEFQLKFHWSLFLRVQLTIFQHWFRQWLCADQATSHYLNQWWLIYRRIYASFGLNELRYNDLITVLCIRL